jgi:hypothetical protein
VIAVGDIGEKKTIKKQGIKSGMTNRALTYKGIEYNLSICV